jgi:hypothetical protein
MAKRITVTALKPLHYEGRSHVRGAVFTTTPVDAAALKYRGKVKLGGQLAGGTVPEHPSIARRMEPVEGFRAETPEAPVKPEPPMPPAEEPVETVEQPGEAPTSNEKPTAPTPGRRGPSVPRRTYQRRDMVAEPPTGE